MQTIKKDELFRNLGGFLKSKGIELNEGSYTKRIQQGCNLLSDAINATQKTVKQTKAQVDQAVDKLRQSIHESTTPAPPPASKSRNSARPSATRPVATKPQRPKGSRKA